jgi:hypothetical protein
MSEEDIRSESGSGSGAVFGLGAGVSSFFERASVRRISSLRSGVEVGEGGVEEDISSASVGWGCEEIESSLSSVVSAKYELSSISQVEGGLRGVLLVGSISRPARVWLLVLLIFCEMLAVWIGLGRTLLCCRCE